MLEVTKERLHELVDALPASKVEAANKCLESLKDEAILEAFRNAPIDDEPVTEEDLKDIEEGRRAVAEGRVQSWEDVKKELGL